MSFNKSFRKTLRGSAVTPAFLAPSIKASKSFIDLKFTFKYPVFKISKSYLNPPKLSNLSLSESFSMDLKCVDLNFLNSEIGADILEVYLIPENICCKKF